MAGRFGQSGAHFGLDFVKWQDSGVPGVDLDRLDAE
jgi:hypothetical protein